MTLARRDDDGSRSPFGRHQGTRHTVPSILETPAEHRFRLLNLLFFLVHQLDAYLDWAERDACRS